jgi:hypothetical protein
MAAFAVAADLASYLQTTFTAGQTATATLLLDLASADIRNYTRQTISRVTDDTVLLRAPGVRELTLPERPVVSVATVKLGTVTVAPAAYLLIGDELVWVASTLSIGNLAEGGAGWGSALVEVTYTHGYATTPDDIKGVCLAVAARGFVNPQGATQQDVNMGPASVSQQFAESVPRLRTVFTDGEKEVLNLYRRRVTCSSLST